MWLDRGAMLLRQSYCNINASNECIKLTVLSVKYNSVFLKRERMWREYLSHVAATVFFKDESLGQCGEWGPCRVLLSPSHGDFVGLLCPGNRGKLLKAIQYMQVEHDDLTGL